MSLWWCDRGLAHLLGLAWPSLSAGPSLFARSSLFARLGSSAGLSVFTEPGLSVLTKIPCTVEHSRYIMCSNFQ